MAIEQNITPYSQYFTGEDKTLSFAIKAADQESVQDISGWTLSYMVKAARDDEDADALITKAGTITSGPLGTCTVALTDDDIAELDAETTYYHELKRTDAGLETVLTFGTFRLNQAVHR